MKCLSIQINTRITAENPLDDLVEATKLTGRYPELDHELRSKGFECLNFFTEHPQQLWKELQAKVISDPKFKTWLSQSAIIACEGENGWDDALLLAHYDSNEKLDSF